MRWYVLLQRRNNFYNLLQHLPQQLLLCCCCCSNRFCGFPKPQRLAGAACSRIKTKGYVTYLLSLSVCNVLSLLPFRLSPA